jgi:hypothetical protein
LATSKTRDRRIRITTAIDAVTWNDHVTAASQGTPFHRRECLEVVAEYGDAILHPLAGVVDGELVGLFPVFERSIGPFTALFSPAPELKVSYLGPIRVGDLADSARVQEDRDRAFVSTVLSCLTDRFGSRYTHVRTTPCVTDPRPFMWDGYDIVPRFTYVVDLTPGAEALLERFSSDARQNVSDPTADMRVEIGAEDAIEFVIEQVTARHREQGEPYAVTPAYVTELYETLSDGAVRPYVVTLDGERVGGMITLRDADTVYRWQGGAKPSVDAPVNDYLDWAIMRDAIEDGRTRYDLVGANNSRITEYKAKFAPELETYYSLTDATPLMEAGARLYLNFR